MSKKSMSKDGGKSVAARMRRADSAEPYFLRGGGEMGERIRRFDWAGTPIGPIESWSPALRTMMSILLPNRFPLLLWWGPQYISFYNDAYSPILGTKHPDRALGMPVSECWSEIWDVLRPLIDSPFQGGPATWMEDIQLELNRYGFVEETHFTIAYSPVPDETAQGGIGGVLATVHEITAKIIGERRLMTVRDLGGVGNGAKTAEEVCRNAARALPSHGKDLPFALFYLMDPDGKRARLAGASGVAMEEPTSPLILDLREGGAGGWASALAQRIDAVQVVPRLNERFDKVPPGPWSDPPSTAVVLPLRSNNALEPSGLLVAGISARLKFDEFYQDFLQLIAAQVATAIADARASEEERKRAEARAELDQAKTLFFGNISHEFRTPLTLMLGPLEELLARREASPESRGELEVVHRNSLRLLKLVNTLLDFTRIEAGRIQASYEPTDLAAYTRELVGVFRAATRKAGLRLVVDCPKLPAAVYVDREMWEKIVLNLVSNAFKFTFEGQIRVALRWRGERVELSVRDTGGGIPASELPRIFERFHVVRGARSRTHEGTGIGLSLVQELARLHGGDVKVESFEGKGTTFTLSIKTGRAHLPPERTGDPRQFNSTGWSVAPFVDEALTGTEEAPHRDLRAVADVSAPDLPRLLIADDNADMRDYLRRLLGQHYRVEAAIDGQAALERARAHPPDLLLTDVMMPRLDGLGLIQQLRADDRTRCVPVIMLSARANEEARLEGLDAGADDYLIKPFSAHELLARLRSQLELGRLRRESEKHFRDKNAVLAQRVTELQNANLEIQEARRAALNVMEDAVESRRLAEILNNEVRVSEIRYRRLFEAANDGVLLLDPDTRKITDANPFMTELLGYPRDQLIGKELFEIGLLKDEAASREVVQKLKRNHEVRYEDLPLESQNGRHQEVEVVANLYQENGHSVIQCNIRDITQRKHAEVISNWLAAIVNSSDDAIIGKNPKGIVTSWNSGAERVFGYSAREMVGHSLMRLIPQGRRNEEKRILGSIKRGQSVERLVTQRQTKDGRLIHVSITSSPIKDASGEVIGVSQVARDITEEKRAEAAERRLVAMHASNRKLEREIVRRGLVEESLKKSEQLQRQLLAESRRMQEKLRHLSRDILRAQEEERKRISRELHDVVAQTLTGINIGLATLKKEAGTHANGFGKQISETQRLVEKSVAVVHRFARELRPTVLDDFGLIPALHSFMKDFTTQTGVRTQLTVFAAVERLNSAKRTVLYRVVQEALANVARHAKATQVEVSLKKTPDGVCLKIKDNGQSFEVDRVLRTKGNGRLGLLGMKERLEMVGGSFSIESAPSRGTTVLGRIPLDKLRRRGGGTMKARKP